MKSFKTLLGVPVILLVALAPLPAAAGPRAHDGGVFLRMSIGAAAGSTSIDVPFNPVQTWKISGGGGDFNLAIGGMVRENLALHGTFFGWSVADPDLEISSSAGSVSAPAHGDFTFSGIGGGLTYYMMPVNIYLSGTVGLGTLSFESADSDLDGRSDSGLGLEACAGKEWWVSDRWALGVALGASYHSIGAAHIDESWSGASIGVRFTATLN